MSWKKQQIFSVIEQNEYDEDIDELMEDILDDVLYDEDFDELQC